MIVVTGIAGFIGMHTARHFLAAGEQVIGIDNLNSYYDPTLKQARLQQLQKDYPALIFLKVDLAEPQAFEQALAPYKNSITHIVHLAAQAGVRYSMEAPRSYIASNINGFVEVLECCRSLPALKHLVYASSSSVYGNRRDIPFSPEQRTDHPISLYAATKKSGEVIAESYAHLYGIAMTGLRFFTVYGPWGRPDMAYFKFTESIVAGTPIQLYNQGDMRRDFTYVDDIVQGIGAVTQLPASGHRIYNLGNHRGEQLRDLVAYLETYLERKAVVELLPMQPGDVYETFADITDSTRDFGYHPRTTLQEGLKPFVQWYRTYHGC
jgi:UDP-glucuronate 4-epimerase